MLAKHSTKHSTLLAPTFPCSCWVGWGDDFWDRVSLCRSFWVSWNLLCRQNHKDLRASTSWVMGLNDYATTPSNPYIFFTFRKGLALHSVAQAHLDLLLFLSLFPKELGLGLWQSRLRCVGFTDTVMTSAPQIALSLGGSDHKGQPHKEHSHCSAVLFLNKHLAWEN